MVNHDLRPVLEGAESRGPSSDGPATLLVDSGTGEVSVLVRAGGHYSWQRIQPRHGGPFVPPPYPTGATVPGPNPPAGPHASSWASVPPPPTPPGALDPPTVPSPLSGGEPSQHDPFGNPRVDAAGFRDQVLESDRIRAARRVSEEVFVEMAKDAGTVVLDCRSREKYDRLHVRGAVNLPLPDITAEELARVIPTKETRVLIYCNNNIADEPRDFPAKVAAAALNLHTFVVLHQYGYTNVFELGPLVERSRSTIPFAGGEAGDDR